MRSYKLKYKRIGAPKVVLFEAESFDAAKALAQKFCKQFKYQLIQVIDEYVDLQKEIDDRIAKLAAEKEKDQGKKEKQVKAQQQDSLKKAS